MVREMSVAGAFYPNSASEIERMLAQFNAVTDAQSSKLRKKPKAVVVPHAGYIYSGFTANVAYRALQSFEPHTVLVIGPSHRVYLNHVSISDFESYDTPLGAIEIDRALIQTLKKNFGLHCQPNAHHEHSTETQMPFIKHYFPKAKVVELVYGQVEYKSLVPIIEFALMQSGCAVAISTDLSHFYTLQQANTLDALCIQALEHKENSEFSNGCEACGLTGMMALTEVAKKNALSTEVLDYRTSADASGDESRVVGYLSAQVY